MPNTTPAQVLKDPNFYQLPVAERQKVLAQLDPNFASLPSAEQVKVVSQGAPAAPNALQRFSQVTLGTQHPVDELRSELKNIYHNPASLAGDVSETLGIPRELWSDPSLHNIFQIGGTGIPGIVFGEHGLIKDPYGFTERITGADVAAEDARNQNYAAIPGDIAGGVTNLALLKKPAEAGAEVASDAVQNARASLANAARTPEGRLTPGARAAAWTAGTVAGGLGGRFFGLPGYGELGGAFLGGRGGPLIADALLPNRPEPMPFYDAYSEYETPEGQVSKMSESPNYENFLAARAAIRKELRAGPQPSLFGENATPSAPGNGGGTPGGDIPPGSPTPFGPSPTPNVEVPGVTARVGGAAQPEPSRIVSPDSPAPPPRITYQSVPRAQLYEMAKRGDLNALAELRRSPAGFDLPPNSRYLLPPNGPMFSPPVADQPTGDIPRGGATPFGSSGTSSSGAPSRSNLQAPVTRASLRSNVGSQQVNPAAQPAPEVPRASQNVETQPAPPQPTAQPPSAPPFSGEDIRNSVDRLRGVLSDPAASLEQKALAQRALDFFGRSQ